MNFWSKLPRPFFVMAPMANVTDCVFRKLFAKYGKPDVMFTEFVSADGLVSDGQKRLLIDLQFSPKERPIVAQLFTGHPEAMKKAAALVAKLGFDGLDLNMGCPDRAVERQGGGAAMMKDQKAAIEVLEAALAGFNGPVSVKTRIGYNKVDLDWIRLLLEQNLPALTIHLRMRKEMSDVPAHWELMPQIIKMRDEIQAGVDSDQRTLIIGNGDVASLEEGATKCKKYGCDGVMIGRGIFGAPWFFEDIKKFRIRKSDHADIGRRLNMPTSSLRKSVEKFDTFQKPLKPRTPAEHLKIMVDHARLFEKEFNPRKAGGKSVRGHKSFAVMRKHFKAYVNGWDGAKELRAKLMETENAAQVAKIVMDYLAS
jgi:tRNA-dihydrouridine synthase